MLRKNLIFLLEKARTRVIKKYSYQKQESITATFDLLGVNRQVYYRAIRSSKDKLILSKKVIDLVLSIRITMPRLGTRKLYSLLESELKALGVGRDKLFRILRANNLLIQPKRNYHVITDSHHRFRKHKNQIRDVEFIRPEQVWVSDITYVGNRENPCYLALVTDAYSKK